MKNMRCLLFAAVVAAWTLQQGVIAPCLIVAQRENPYSGRVESAAEPGACWVEESIKMSKSFQTVDEANAFRAGCAQCTETRRWMACCDGWTLSTPTP